MPSVAAPRHLIRWIGASRRMSAYDPRPNRVRHQAQLVMRYQMAMCYQMARSDCGIAHRGSVRLPACLLRARRGRCKEREAGIDIADSFCAGVDRLCLCVILLMVRLLGRSSLGRLRIISRGRAACRDLFTGRSFEWICTGEKCQRPTPAREKAHTAPDACSLTRT